MIKVIVSIFLIMHLVTYISCEIKRAFNYNPRSYVMPESCKGLRFCHDKGQFYPTEDVNRVLRGLTIQDRIGGETTPHISDFPLENECATNEMKVKPVYYILDNNNRARVVIQSNEYKFLQKYDIRWCRKEGRVFRTLHFGRSVLNHVNMTCNNLKTILDFQVLTPNKLGMELISVEMPVFCKARYDKYIKLSS